MSRICLSDVQRQRVFTEDGRRLGHVFDIATRLERADRSPVLQTLLIGRGGLARRLGIGRGRVMEIPIERITHTDDGRIVVDASFDASARG
jgi:sporulation protein YlmC with PRC-barrel domain